MWVRKAENAFSAVLLGLVTALLLAVIEKKMDILFRRNPEVEAAGGAHPQQFLHLLAVNDFSAGRAFGPQALRYIALLLRHWTGLGFSKPYHNLRRILAG